MSYASEFNGVWNNHITMKKLSHRRKHCYTTLSDISTCTAGNKKTLSVECVRHLDFRCENIATLSMGVASDCIY